MREIYTLTIWRPNREGKIVLAVVANPLPFPVLLYVFPLCIGHSSTSGAHGAPHYATMLFIPLSVFSLQPFVPHVHTAKPMIVAVSHCNLLYQSQLMPTRCQIHYQ